MPEKRLRGIRRWGLAFLFSTVLVGQNSFVDYVFQRLLTVRKRTARYKKDSVASSNAS
jgi:hypothetical protein